MSGELLLIWLIIGGIAGFLAGLIVKGYGFGVVGNVIVGIVGAALAGIIFPRLGIFTGSDVVGSIMAATIGAVILLLLVRFLKRV